MKGITWVGKGLENCFGRKNMIVIPSSDVITLAGRDLSSSGSFFMSVISICVAVGLQFASNLQHDLKTSTVILHHRVFRSPSYFVWCFGITLRSIKSLKTSSVTKEIYVR